MPTYVIERHIPGVGKMSAEELRVISQKSNEILSGLGPTIRWLHSYFVDDAIFCVYEAEGHDLILEHARCMGIPATHIHEVRAIASPATGAK